MIVTAIWRLCFSFKPGMVYPQLDNSKRDSNIDFQMTVNRKEKKKAINALQRTLNNDRATASVLLQAFCCILSAVCTAEWLGTWLSSTQAIKGNGKWHEPVNTDARSWNFMGSIQDNFWEQNVLGALKEDWDGKGNGCFLSPPFPGLLMFLLGNQYTRAHLTTCLKPRPQSPA